MPSGSLIDLRPSRGGKGASKAQSRLFKPRSFHEPESPKRPASLRTRRRKVRILIALGILLLLAGLAYGVSFASYLPQVSINSISIVGAKDVPQELVRRHVETILEDGSRHVLSRTNIFIYPRADIEKAVEGFFPRIRAARISRDSFLSTEIIVTVVERDPFALWCAEGTVQCYSMDDGGFIFTEASNGTSSPNFATHYIFRGGLPAQAGVATTSNVIGQKFVAGHLPGIIALLELLGQAGFEAVGATIDNAQDFLVPFAEGFTVKASFGQEANTLTKNLELILSSDALRGKEANIEYIDLRFDNRVYYKLKGEEQQSTE